MAGFQLLDIQDFSGQGTALIGILDVFMESKGLITSKKWREFCCETVPLLIMKKYTWTNDESFRRRIQVAHYGPADLLGQRVNWSLKSGRKVVEKGGFKADIPTGDVAEVDVVCVPLEAITTAQKLTFEITLPGTPYRNSYDLWVYPADVDTRVPNDVTVARALTPQVKKKLVDGGNILLIPEPGALSATVEMAFQTGFWSPMFRMKGRICPATGKETPGTQGILLDPQHPVFEDFPTEFHGNWQWWQLVKNCDPMILDSTDQAFRPTIQVIDGIDRNHKLGLVLEAQVGKGRLLICTIHLPELQQYPEARQLLAGIQTYMASSDFAPDYSMAVKEVEAIVG